FGGRIDILGLDGDGNTVVIECKRDRTPRETIAQTLDYASWIAHLTTRQIHEIAIAKLGKPLENAFRERFAAELPEALNESHSLATRPRRGSAASREQGEGTLVGPLVLQRWSRKREKLGGLAEVFIHFCRRRAILFRRIA